MEMGEYIRKLRKEHGMTMEELGARLQPPVNRSGVNKWEKGLVTNIKRTHIEQMAMIFGIKPSELMCFQDKKAEVKVTYYDSCKIPVLGKVAAGIPIEMIEDISEYEEIPKEMCSTSSYFALKVKGDSMFPRICEGDVLIIRQQCVADSGDVVIAAIGNEDATCKKLIKHPNGITLVSFNPSYEPMYFSNNDIVSLPITILGKVVENRQKF